MRDADKIKRMTMAERRIWIEVSRELRELEQWAAARSAHLEEAAEELKRGKANLKYNPGEASEGLLAQRQANFDTCSAELNETLDELEAAKARLLADPVRAAMAALEIEEMEKRMRYISSQEGFQAARGAAAQGELKYRLRESGLVDGGMGNAVYYAELVADVHIRHEQVVREVAEQAGLRESAAEAALGALEDVVLSHLRANQSVSLGAMFVVRPTLRGTCTQAEAQKELSFKPYVTVKTQPDFQKRFRSRLAVRRLRGMAAGPGLIDVEKLHILGDSDVIRPGVLVKFIGDRLDYNLNCEDEGIFLYTDRTRANPYRLEPLGSSKEFRRRREITVLLPTTLPWGTVFQVEFRRRLPHSSQLRAYLAPFVLDFPPAPNG